MRRQLVAVNLELRSSQKAYLEYLAESESRRALAGEPDAEDEPSISLVLRRLFDRLMAAHPNPGKRTAKKQRSHVSLAAAHVEFIDAMAARAGVSRSDMARRLIDAAAANDETVRIAGERSLAPPVA